MILETVFAAFLLAAGFLGGAEAAKHQTDMTRSEINRSHVVLHSTNCLCSCYDKYISQMERKIEGIKARQAHVGFWREREQWLSLERDRKATQAAKEEILKIQRKNCPMTGSGNFF